MKSSELYLTFTRYLSLVLLALPNLFIFYFIFTPLTYFTTLWYLSKYYAPNLTDYGIEGSFFVIQTLAGREIYATIVSACVAGAAYYLLVILNLTTPMSIAKRVGSLFFLLGAFFILNTAGIIYFISVIIQDDFNFFDAAHTSTWYFGSTIFVILLWFATVLIFRIKTIPVYTDFKKIFNEILGKHKDLD